MGRLRVRAAPAIVGQVGRAEKNGKAGRVRAARAIMGRVGQVRRVGQVGRVGRDKGEPSVFL